MHNQIIANECGLLKCSVF